MKSIILILCVGAVLINCTSDTGQRPANVKPWKKFHTAARLGDLPKIKELLRMGTDVNILDTGERTPLFTAAANGHDAVVLLLLKNGADVNLKQKYGRAPIFDASYNGYDRVVEILIKYGADVNIRKDDGWTPLNMAAKKGYLRIVELLLKAGADINIQTNDKQTSLYIATSAGHEDVVSMLLEKGADVNIQEIYGSAPLHKAVEISFVEIIGCLRRKGANVHLKNGKNESAYDIAVKQGNKTIIDILVPSMKPWKKLHKAARDGNVQEIKELLANGVDVNIPDPGERTPLFTAAANGQSDAVKVLLENGANINLKNKYGRAPIFDATINDHYDVVKILIDRGADINIRKYDGWTPLNMAAKKGYLRIVELLLRKGASVNIQTFSGETPLYLAAMAGHKDVVQKLIQHGANVYLIEDHGGWSPLHRAVENGFGEIVEILVANKADAYSKNHYNATPWSIAHNKGNLKIIELLRKAPRIAEIVCRSFGETATPRILGGERTEDGEFPWMAALGYLDRKVLVYRCGGTIISDQFVLTAAHCIRKNYKPTIVRLGKASLLDESNDTITAVMHNIQDIFVHPDYNATTMWNDIALLQVIDKIIFNDLVSPACLHSNLGDLPSNVPLTVTGWGTTDWRRSTTPSKYLLKVNLTSMPLEECKSKLITGPRVNDTSLRNGLFNGQYCAYGDAEKDACHGDSGGPLTYLRTNTSTIVGVVSFGYGCGLDIPSIYTRVSHYLDWIEPHVWSNLDNSN